MTIVHRWHSVTEKTWDTITHDGPLSSLGSEYVFFDCDGKKVSADCGLNEVHAVPCPRGVEAYVAIAIVTAIVTAALLPKPEIPQNAGVSRTSPNNQANSQSNTARLGQGKPDIRGTVKSYPDLIQVPWYYFDTNTQLVLQKFLVGVRGFGTNAVIKVGETDIENMSGAEYHWEGDGTLGGGEEDLGGNHLYYPARNDGVESMKVLTEQDRTGYIYLYSTDIPSNTITIGALYKKGLTGETEEFAEAIEVNEFGSIFIEDTSGLYTLPYTGKLNYFKYIKFPNFEIAAGIFVDLYSFYIYGTTIAASYVAPAPFSDTSDTIGLITRGDIDTDGWTEWQYIKPLPYAMLNLAWPQGLLNGSGVPTTCAWEVEFANEGGTVSSVSGTKIAYNNSPVYESVLMLPVSGNVARFRVRRTTNDTGGPNDMVIDSCFSLGLYDGSITGNGILSTTYRGSRYSSVPVTGNVSIIPQPEYYTYNGSAISLVTPPAVRNSFADSVLTDLVLVYGTSLATIQEAADIDELYDIESALDSNERAFSYTFDDTDIDLKARIETACNCARVIAYESNGKWRFTREESKPITAIFNRRNIAGNSENEMSISFVKPLDKNGVSVKYIDPTTYKEAYVHRSIDVASFTTDEPSRPLEIDLAGCSNTTQANNRADLEVRKLVYQRRSVKERVASDGLELDLGDRVAWASIYDDALAHGEIMEVIDADNVRVSEPVAGTLYTHYTTIAGAVVGPITCTGSGFILTRSSGPTFASAFVADDDNQAGSMFVAGDTVDLDYADMTVVAIKPNDDDTVDIEMVEYNELCFEED